MKYKIFLLAAFALVIFISACQDNNPTVPIVTQYGNDAVSAKATHRPIEEFVDAQGTFCFPDGSGGCLLFVPPIENFIGWYDFTNSFVASVDYAGLADKWAGGAFGTKIRGTVTEIPKADGRAEIKVVLHTRNALMWVAKDLDFNGELAFGSRAPEVVDEGAIPALGTSLFKVSFMISAPGAPLPDLIEAIFFGGIEGFELLKVSIVASADGELACNGDPARLQVVQQGLFTTGGGGATADGFPVEFIKLHPDLADCPE